MSHDHEPRLHERSNDELFAEAMAKRAEREGRPWPPEKKSLRRNPFLWISLGLALMVAAGLTVALIDLSNEKQAVLLEKPETSPRPLASPAVEAERLFNRVSIPPVWEKDGEPKLASQRPDQTDAIYSGRYRAPEGYSSENFEAWFRTTVLALEGENEACDYRSKRAITCRVYVFPQGEDYSQTYHVVSATYFNEDPSLVWLTAYATE